MTVQGKSGNEQIKAFEASLTRIFGPNHFPPETVGDLSDLLETLHRGVEMLTSFMEPGGDFEQTAPFRLLELEILIADDLPMIAKDLLPVLKKLRRKAYSENKLRHKSKPRGTSSRRAKQ